ncbi:DrmB family protein [Pelotomaculum propionicicum]|uniref:DrmB family protein n=1 Tax=Pelotomaculum propionicicum TaxID=258475 RepID=UPI003B7BC8B1
MKVPKGPIRRSQLIAPFGVGALIVTRDGTSLVSCGLDHWYKREDGSSTLIDPDEYKFHEWRLERLLNVSHLRLPPDYRKKRRFEDNIPNTYLTVPFLRFPRWHYCTKCGRLVELPLSVRGRAKCPDCAVRGKTWYLVQVPFVAVCDHGHMQDFPWREWVHRNSNPDCDLPLRLRGTGGATLGSQFVSCDCGIEKRSLASITSARPDGRTELSENLERGFTYLCKGILPWHGKNEGETCNRSLRGSLRSATNLYFAQVRSSIYLPRGNDVAPQELIARLEQPPLSTLVNLLTSSGVVVKPEYLRGQHFQLVHEFSDEQLLAALNIVLGSKEIPKEPDSIIEDWETSFRREEYNLLRSERDEKELRIRPADLTHYEKDVAHFFSKIMLVDKLMETRALAGFQRIFPENDQTLEQQKALLWLNKPQQSDEWLPAYKVFGEGIYIEVKEENLQNWMSLYGESVNTRLEPLIQRYHMIQNSRRLRDRPIGPRFVLLHTFAHLLINRLTFECGYSSAALRERLYVSDNPDAPMAGILIYTAAGDAEGTLGGLVRMAKQGYFEPMVRRALEGAKWCSADPVCMEMGRAGGQGPDSCNLAACHCCALVPETACEEFNRFLDRALLVGSMTNRSMGFFKL